MATHSTAPHDQARALKVLVSAASAHGATAEIADEIRTTLSRHGFAVTMMTPDRVRSVDDYGAVIIGSAVYAGHWLDPAKDLMYRFRGPLAHRPVWLFSSGPVGKPSGKPTKAMAKDPVDLSGLRAAVHIRGHRIFPGKLDRTALSRPQRAALLLFRGLNGDFRDWDGVRQWADGLARELEDA